MTNREQLSARGRRAYELGRLRSAARVAIYLGPLALFCALQASARQSCACFGVLLLTLSIWLRWRNRRAGESVTTGLLAGSVPLFAGLLFARLAPECSPTLLLSACAAPCLVAGALAGVWIGVRTTRERAGLASWTIAGGIALLAATLGCIDLGASAVLSVGLGLLLGETGAALLLTPASE